MRQQVFFKYKRRAEMNGYGVQSVLSGSWSQQVTLWVIGTVLDLQNFTTEFVVKEWMLPES